MDNSNIQIIVGANIGATKNVLKEDLQTVAQLISRDQSVKVAVSLNESVTRGNFEAQLSKVMKLVAQKDYSVNIKTNIIDGSKKTSATSKVDTIAPRSVTNTQTNLGLADANILKLLASGNEEIQKKANLAKIELAGLKKELLAIDVISKDKSDVEKYSLLSAKTKELTSLTKSLVTEMNKPMKTETKLELVDEAQLTKANELIGNIKTSFYQLKDPLESNKIGIEALSGELDKIRGKDIGQEQSKDLDELMIKINAYTRFVEIASSQQLKKDASVEKLADDWVKATNKMTEYFNKNSRVSSDPELKDKVQQLTFDIGNSDKSEASLKNIDSQFRSITHDAKLAGLEGASFGDQIQQVASKYGIFLTLSTAIRGVTNALKEMVSTSLEINKSFVDLQMVTGGTNKETNALLSTYNEIGNKLGATTVEVAKAGDSWLRQGESIESTNKLIEASIVLSKVGSISTAESTQYLTSALKGYKLGAEEVMTVVDKLSAVDLISATSTAGLAEAMSRVATSADLAGISMDNLLGMIAIVGETTQKEMSSVGTSFQSIFSRMADIKLGKLEDEDGENITQALSDAELVLDRVDIKLRKNATTFNNFGDVIGQVANKWSTLNDIEQASIAKAFAGKQSLCSSVCKYTSVA